MGTPASPSVSKISRSLLYLSQFREIFKLKKAEYDKLILQLPESIDQSMKALSKGPDSLESNML